ncbi:portal protein [Sphingomonas sp. MG17]|uniref:Portal protein n=1 Tax=Sphingomonas tagetis TaxID=2949092 RepID=A0A9X2HIU7_9SPHN|nr:portal protein [Sphingomonas tagetis]MCP3730432.1 portal protein [Sphingomonas tagetis]
MFDAKEALAAQGRMELGRSNFDQQWQEAAELCLPRQADFPIGGQRQQGENRSNQIFDEHAQQAVDDGVSVFEGWVKPKGQIWQLLTPPDDELLRYQHVAAWYERISHRLHKLRASALSGYDQQSNESVYSLMAFGNQAMEVEPRRDPVSKAIVGLRYRSEHIGRVYIETDWQGLPSRRHVKFTLTGPQALERFGRAALERAPLVLKAALANDDQQRSKPFEFLRVLKPNTAIDSNRLDWRGKVWVNGFLSIEDRSFVEEGGYRSPPLIYSRFRQSPTEDYGRGPGTDVLPAIKAAQAVMIDVMAAAELGLRPPLGAPDDATDMLINYIAAEITYGAVDRRGNQLVKPLFEVGEMQGALAVMEIIHRVIDRACFRHLLMVNQDMKSHVTDSQIYERLQEKGVLLSPMGRQETEWFTPMLDREIDIMDMMGEFDDMPGEVIEAGGLFGTEYDNPLNRALKAAQAGGYFRALDKVVAVAQYDRTALDAFLEEYPIAKAVLGIGKIEGIPASWRATAAEKRAAAAAREQQQQLQQIQQLGESLEPVTRVAGELSGALDAA